MKLQLNKKKLKNLSKDAQILPENMTPNVGGGIDTSGSLACDIETARCQSNPQFCGPRWTEESRTTGNC